MVEENGRTFTLVEKGHLARAARPARHPPAPEARSCLQKFLPRQRIEALPLGLTSSAQPDYENARQQLGWKPEELVLLFLSRIHVKKGLNLLLAGARRPRHLPEHMLGSSSSAMAGAAYVDSLQRFADGKRRENCPTIEWKGAVWGDARWPYFQGADLFCLPTHSENFGLAVLEACQVGTPALTTTETPWGTELAAGRAVAWIGKPAIRN